MKKTLYFLFALSYFQLTAQLDISFESKKFDGESILFSDFSAVAGVVVLSDSSIVLYYYEEDSSVNVSSAFDGYDLTQISVVQGVDASRFFVGTANTYLYLYDHGEITHIDSSYGLKSPSVNSMYYADGVLSFGTGKGAFKIRMDSLMVANLSITNDYYTDYEVRILEPSPHTLSFEISKDGICGNIKGKTLIHSSPTAIYNIGYITHEATADSEVVRDEVSIGSSPFYRHYYSYSVFGSNYGLKYFGQKNCYTEEAQTIIENVEVNDLFLFPRNSYMGLPNVLFVSTQQGLYYLDDPYNNILVPKVEEIVKLKSKNVYTVSHNLCTGKLFVSAEDGLYVYNVNNPIKPDLELDIEYAPDLPFCTGAEIPINGLALSGFDYKWSRNDTMLSDQTGNELIAINPGLYKQHYSNCIINGENIIANIYYNDSIDAEISYHGFLETCYNGNLFLEVARGPSNYKKEFDLTYQWFVDGQELTDETQTYFFPDSSGEYYFVATNCNGVSKESDRLAVNVGDYVPIPEFRDSTEQKDFCLGGSLQLINADGFEVTWYHNSSVLQVGTASYMLQRSDTSPNRVTYKNENGCTSELNFSSPYVYQNAPNLRLDLDTIKGCGLSNPEIDYQQPYDIVVEWSDGFVGDRRTLESAGIYYIDAYNRNADCRHDRDTIVYLLYSRPGNALPDDTTLMVGDSLRIVLNNKYDYYWHNEPFQYLFENEIVLTSTVARPITLYTVVTNEHGCTSADQLTVEFKGEGSEEPLESGELPKTDFQAVPNPFSEQLIIAGTDEKKIYKISLLDLSGKLIRQETPANDRGRVIWKTGSLPKGVYILNVYGSGPASFQSFRLVK